MCTASFVLTSVSVTREVQAFSVNSSMASAGARLDVQTRHAKSPLTSLQQSKRQRHSSHNENDADDSQESLSSSAIDQWRAPVSLAKNLVSIGLAACLVLGSPVATPLPVYAAASEQTTTSQVKYDGFAEYAKENQMEQSDVGCFVSKCGSQTKDLFSNPRGIKGVSCLGRCKGEQSCATRCFAEFGSEALNNWLSCTIEEYECVKVPKNIDNSAENVGYASAVTEFDASKLVGTWYKTDGLNPNYDLFDCQTNTFSAMDKDANELDMGIFFRVRRPPESGGGFWENALTEHMVVDVNSNNEKKSVKKQASQLVANAADKQQEYGSDNVDDDEYLNSAGRTMHTSGKMYGLEFRENWFIIGQSDGQDGIPPFRLVAYKGHTLQGNYEGAFVYAKEPVLPEAAIPAVREAAAKAGLDFNDFTRIDNTCPAGDSLNDAEAGTGTSTTDWVDLVVGEGGVVDWVFPGWRGEYKNR
jgi:VDE lipocalin domain